MPPMRLMALSAALIQLAAHHHPHGLFHRAAPALQSPGRVVAGGYFFRGAGLGLGPRSISQIS